MNCWLSESIPHAELNLPEPLRAQITCCSWLFAISFSYLHPVSSWVVSGVTRRMIAQELKVDFFMPIWFEMSTSLIPSVFVISKMIHKTFYNRKPTFWRYTRRLLIWVCVVLDRAWNNIVFAQLVPLCQPHVCGQREMKNPVCEAIAGLWVHL